MEPTEGRPEEVQSQAPLPASRTAASSQAAGEARSDPASSLPLYRFSIEAQAILAAATEQARGLRHAEIRPEHLLLAFLLDRGAALIRPMLRSAGIDGPEMERLRIGLVERLRGVEVVEDGSLTLSAGCKQIIQTALAEALRGTRPVRPAVAPVEPVHLMMGLISEGTALNGSQITTGLAMRGLRVALGSGAWRPGRLRPDPARPTLPLVQHGVQVTTDEPTSAPTMTRANVVTFRISDDELAAVDALVDSGAMRTRSEASGWLLHAGIVAQQDFFNQIRALSDEIARLRQEVQRLADERIGRRSPDQDAPDTTSSTGLEALTAPASTAPAPTQ